MLSDKKKDRSPKPSRVMSASQDMERQRVVEMSVEERVCAALNMKRNVGFEATCKSSDKNEPH